MHHDYSSLLNRLLSVSSTGMKLGLSNSERLSSALGHPHNSYKTIHVAGTNGKGSVSTKMAAALQASGARTGLYTSPHIACFRERIRIDGEMIPEKSAAQILQHIFSIVETYHIPATFFEITTLLALAYFAQQKVDAAVIETGLGGRLDATNIIHPQLSIITSISLEHTEILGHTIEAITKEKAGIIKSSAPVIIGPSVPYEIVHSIAASMKCPCTKVSGAFEDYHAENNAIAKTGLEMLNVSANYIKQGLTAVPPCRTETIQRNKTIILDVAHNPHGMQQLLKTISHRYPKKPLRFVLGLSSNKDIDGCLSIIKDHAAHFHLVEAESKRAASKEVLRDHLINLGLDPKKITCENSVADAVDSALSCSDISDDVVIICGTFFIMKEARKALNFNDPQDPFNLNSL